MEREPSPWMVRHLERMLPSGGAINFSGAVTADQGGATAVGTGAGAGAVTFWINTCIDQWRK